MCDVHLVPEVDDIRTAAEPLSCGECDDPIQKGEQYRYIEGPLDDGSGRRYRYRAHYWCYELSESDVGEDGCFNFGGVEPA